MRLLKFPLFIFQMFCWNVLATEMPNKVMVCSGLYGALNVELNHQLSSEGPRSAISYLERFEATKIHLDSGNHDKSINTSDFLVRSETASSAELAMVKGRIAGVLSHAGSVKNLSSNESIVHVKSLSLTGMKEIKFFLEAYELTKAIAVWSARDRWNVFSSAFAQQARFAINSASFYSFDVLRAISLVPILSKLERQYVELKSNDSYRKRNFILQPGFLLYRSWLGLEIRSIKKLIEQIENSEGLEVRDAAKMKKLISSSHVYTKITEQLTSTYNSIPTLSDPQTMLLGFKKSNAYGMNKLLKIIENHSRITQIERSYFKRYSSEQLLKSKMNNEIQEKDWNSSVNRIGARWFEQSLLESSRPERLNIQDPIMDRSIYKMFEHILLEKLPEDQWIYLADHFFMAKSELTRVKDLTRLDLLNTIAGAELDIVRHMGQDSKPIKASESHAWVGIDLLLHKDPNIVSGSEPRLTIIFRHSDKPPEYEGGSSKKNRKDKEKEALWVPGLQPIPIPVSGQGR
ncbi:MAG: hypothetical protein AB8E15_05505 [Bdellovibrionales bacterium]